jgi:hypothetical protein
MLRKGIVLHLPVSSRRLRAAAVPCAAAAFLVAGLGARVAPVEAQTLPTQAPAVVTTTTGPLSSSPIVTVIADATAPAGTSALAVPGTLRSTVLVTNPGTLTLSNLQLVVRFGAKPDQILSVSDGSGNVGIVDGPSGYWYHTIATLSPGATGTYTVSWVKYCPGRWVLAARAGDRVASQVAAFAGPSDARCPADDATNPLSASSFQLAWPPSSLAPLAATTTAPVAPTSTGLVTPSSTVPPTLSGPVPTSTVPPGATSTTPGGSSANAGPTTTRALLPTAATTTILSLPRATTTTVAPSTTRPAPTTTIPRSTTTKPGTVIFCKTVGGRRYCAPKSSVYKEGQEKTVELKPGQKAPTTKKTTKKTTTKTTKKR